MNKTSEALREDIKSIFPAWDTAVQMNDKRMNEIINKILDVAEKRIKESFSYHSDPKLAFTASNIATDEINKLRPNK